MPAFVFFDVGGTLLHFAPSHAVVVGTALRDLGIDVTPEDAARAVRTARRAYGGRPDPVNLELNREWWLGLFGRVLAEVDRAADDPLRDELYARHMAGDWLLPAEDTIATLEQLAERGHRMGVISNWDESLTSILDRRGLLPFFEFVVSSADLGAAKPDARIFERALDLARVTPAETVHVGDDLDADVRGASAVGIRPILLTSRHSSPTDRVADSIGSLGELLDLLSC